MKEGHLRLLEVSHYTRKEVIIGNQPGRQRIIWPNSESSQEAKPDWGFVQFFQFLFLWVNFIELSNQKNEKYISR